MKKIVLIIALLAIGVLVGALLPQQHTREHFMETKDAIHKEQLSQGNYRCCLEKPCTYCIEKSPGHGEGASCTCLDDIYNGKHPCGECIGEILEGHGNPLIAEYFPRAIAEETGNYEAIKGIIVEKYDISEDDIV